MIKLNHDIAICLSLSFVLGIKLFLPMWPSPHTYKVVDGVVDALTSQSPRDRYLVGLDATIYAWLARLPAVVADFLLKRLSFRLPVPPKKRI